MALSHQDWVEIAQDDGERGEFKHPQRSIKWATRVNDHALGARVWKIERCCAQ